MAQPSIRALMQIGDGPTFDTFDGRYSATSNDTLGFIYIESDTRTAPPEKKRETTSYAEEEGEHTDLRTVDDVFDYKVTFLIECPNSNIENANIKIKKFNNLIRSVEDGIKTCTRITFVNYYKRVSIKGIPEVIAEPKELYRDIRGKVFDCVLVELTIHVDKPSECDFAISTPSSI